MLDVDEAVNAVDLCERMVRPFRDRIDYLERRISAAESVVYEGLSNQTTDAYQRWEKIRDEGDNRIS